MPMLAEQTPVVDSGVEVTWGLSIPMRDGIHLNGTLYSAPDQKDPLPAILAITPYIADSNNAAAMYFARNGYSFITVDSRGRGNSEGTYVPFFDDGRDGYDTVEWIATQSWCNGKVAMWGLSYGGFVQWAIAKELPPHLAAILPAAAAYPGVDFPLAKGIFEPGIMEWLTLTRGRTADFQLFSDGAFWVDKINQLYRQKLPLEQMDVIVGNPSPIFHTWLANRTNMAYWGQATPSADQYAKINIPILTITAVYDGDQSGALTYYRRHSEHASAAAASKSFLVIGPWDHGGTVDPNLEVGGIKLGPASKVNVMQVQKEFLDWNLKAGARPEFLKKRVAWYIAALDEWRYADKLGDISDSSVTLYIHSNGVARSAFRSGQMTQQPPKAEPSDSYIYNPLDVVDAEPGLGVVKDYLIQQQDVMKINGDGVVYHTDPLPADMTVSGPPKLKLWISLDVPDTDFMGTLYEIQPDGTSIMLARDILRARYRKSTNEPMLVKKGEIDEYDFTSFPCIGRRIKKGNVLRLVLTAPNPIYFEKNYNGGGDVAKESGKDAHTAHITVYHDAQHPSALELPVLQK